LILKEQSKSEREAKPSRKLRVLKILGWGLLFLIVLVLLGLLALRSSKVQNYLVDRAVTRLSADMGAEVTVGHVDIDWFTRLQLNDVVVHDPAFPSDTLLSARTLGANVHLFNFWQKKLNVDEFRISNLELHLKKLEDGTLNIENCFSQSNSGGSNTSWEIGLNQIKLRDATISFLNMQTGSIYETVLHSMLADIRQIDLDSNHVEFNRVVLEKPQTTVKMGSIQVSPKGVEEAGKPLELPWTIQLDKLKLEDGELNYDLPLLGAVESSYAFNNINLDVIDGNWDKENGKIIVSNFSFDESGGAGLKKMRSQINFSNRRLGFGKLLVETKKGSIVRDSLNFKFREFADFEKFEDKIYLNGTLKESVVAVEDILTYVPRLKEIPFWRSKANQLIQIDGAIRGKLNSLKVDDIRVKLGSGLTAIGNFRSRNLFKPSEASLNLNIERLSTNINEIKLLFPAIKFPEEFGKLGSLVFDGRFDGFLVDFVAFGKLNTDLGVVSSDMRMDLKGGASGAKYSGLLSVADFKLDKWFDDADFGNTSFDLNIAGNGLRYGELEANIEGEIEEFNYRGFKYQNALVDGLISGKSFKGKAAMDSEFMAFDLSGNVNLESEIPKIEVVGEVEQLNLFALNLSKVPLQLKGLGDFNFSGVKIDDFIGSAKGNDVSVFYKDVWYDLDTLEYSSALNANGEKELQFKSEFANADIKGQFKVGTFISQIKRYLQQNQSSVWNQLVLRNHSFTRNGNALKEGGEQNFKFKLQIVDNAPFFELIDSSLQVIESTRISGAFNSSQGLVAAQGDIGAIEYDGFSIGNSKFKFDAIRENATMQLSADTISNGQGFNGAGLVFGGVWNGRTLSYDAELQRASDQVRNAHASGMLALQEENIVLNIDSSSVLLFDDVWSVNADNRIDISLKGIFVNDLSLYNGDRRINIQSDAEKKTNVSFKQFPLAALNDLINDPNVQLGGIVNGEIKVDEARSFKGANGFFVVDSFMYMGDYWGELNGTLSSDNISSPINVDLLLKDNDRNISGKGSYLPSLDGQKDDLNLKIDVANYPVSFLEYYVGKFISNTTGVFNGNLSLNGPTNQLTTSGMAHIAEGATSIDYLNTRYFLKDFDLRITDDMLDMTGNIIYDELGNTAEVIGGITHKNLNKLGLDLNIESSDFLALNTTKNNNKLYYGRGIGDISVSFKGGLNSPDISVVAKVGRGTSLYLPVFEADETQSTSFVEFVDSKNGGLNLQIPINKGEKRARNNRFGINFYLDLEINPEAYTYIIFNAAEGDQIVSQGQGLLKIETNKSGDFNIVGTYTVVEGKYNFVFRNIINKAFTLKEGGQISWKGDPYDATLNLTANFSKQFPIYNFIQEYLDTEGLESEAEEAKQPKDVLLNMELTGSLLQPDISFGLSFPGLGGALDNFTTAKLQSLERDPNGLNNQVFGLMVLNQFIPINSGPLESGSNQVVTGGINTVSEMLTNQFSAYVTDLLSRYVEDVNFIDNVELDFDYQVYNLQDDPTLSTGYRAGSSLQLDVPINMFNNKLLVRVGGNLNLGSSDINGSNLGNFVTGDFLIEYKLNSSGQLKFRFYRRVDELLEGRKQLLGAGLAYRKEFDSLNELFAWMFRGRKKS